MKKCLRHTADMLMIVTVLFLTTAFGQNMKNLLPNSGFEIGEGDNLDGWMINIGTNKTVENWFMINTDSPRSHQVGRDRTEFHSGTSSCKISRVWSYAGQTTGIQTAIPIPLDPQKRYLLSFWYKTKGITEYPIPMIVESKIYRKSTSPLLTEKRVDSSDKWRHYFIILENIPEDVKNLDLSFYCWMRTTGSIWLDDIEFREASEKDVAMHERWRRQANPPKASKAGTKKFAATGFYRVEKAGKRWWVIDPKGNPTWAASIDGETVAPGPRDPVTQTEWFRKEYGTTPEEVTKKLYDIFVDLGFNTFAGWTNDRFADVTAERYQAGQPYMPMVKVLGLMGAGGEAVKARDRNGKIPSTDNRWFVDPFNPDWRKAARERAEQMIPDYKDKPWFLGWFVDNEVFYEDLFAYVWAEYSSKEFMKVLEQKYKKIDELNRTWTSRFGKYSYGSFNDILTDKPEPKDWDDPLWKDFIAFERHMIGTYIDFTYGLVKELDPNHLLISNRLHWRPLPNIYRTIDLWGKYDIVCMNIYPNNNIIGFDAGERQVMRMLNEGTGRPIIIGEYSMPAKDSKLYELGPDSLNRPLDWSWHQLLRTQKERAETFEMHMRQLVSTDYMIGLGWFKTFDPNQRNRRSNRGLMTSDGHLYRELAETMKRIHREVKMDMGLKW